jgi:mannose-6-phosphate isomerase-like protein (cupin superfamily)
MSHLFLKTLKAKRISQEEKEYIGRSLEALSHSINSNSIPNPREINAVTSALYIFTLSSEENKKEVLEFIDWFGHPEDDKDWSEDLMSIISGFFGELQLERVGDLLERISLQRSLTNVDVSGELKSSLSDPNLRGLYNNKVDALNIDFTVSILPFDMEVLDPRIVTVQPGKANEMHRHAHETVFIFLKGKGKVLVDDFENEVGPGDFAFIPRWCNHQSVNTGSEELVFLAVADFGLTGKSFVGNYMKTARMKTV